MVSIEQGSVEGWKGGRMDSRIYPVTGRERGVGGIEEMLPFARTIVL
jgi:hypothetical protein